MIRFHEENQTVIDRQTGLMWTKNASLFKFSLTWNEAFNSIKELNQAVLYGYQDWRIPNRKELLSLMSFDAINPSLPIGHPFTNVFTSYYWTSSTCVRLPKQAWYVHLGGARVFKGLKDSSYMVWPVRSAEEENTGRLFQTGQKQCFDENGVTIDCRDTGQDGELQAGLMFSKDRFTHNNETVLDSATGLIWLRNADIHMKPVDWESAFDLISVMNDEKACGYNDWRIPNIFELESLTDLSRHSSALPEDHPFHDVKEFYWSSTTSMYNTDYAWALYMTDGAVGVGFKPLVEFYLWPVRGPERTMLL